MSLRWMMPTVAGVGSAAAAAQSARIPIVVTAISISGLLAILIMILCYVAVFGSCSRSTRAIKVLALLIGRTRPDPPEGGEAQSDS